MDTKWTQEQHDKHLLLSLNVIQDMKQQLNTKFSTLEVAALFNYTTKCLGYPNKKFLRIDILRYLNKANMSFNPDFFDKIDVNSFIVKNNNSNRALFNPFLHSLKSISKLS